MAPSPARTIVFVLGAPGAGKGTQCARIATQWQWQHLSTGDLLRNEVAAGSQLGLEVQALMQAGEMLPTGIVLDLLTKAMQSSGATRFLVDGFPRRADQLQKFEAQIQPADFVLVFTVPEETAVARLVKRGETSGRADDNEDTIRNRMQVFAAESQPVIDALKETGRVAEIDAQGDADEVFQSVVPILEMLQAKAAEKEAAAAADQAENAIPEPEAEQHVEDVQTIDNGVDETADPAQSEPQQQQEQEQIAETGAENTTEVAMVSETAQQLEEQQTYDSGVDSTAAEEGVDTGVVSETAIDLEAAAMEQFPGEGGVQPAVEENDNITAADAMADTTDVKAEVENTATAEITSTPVEQTMEGEGLPTAELLEAENEQPETAQETIQQDGEDVTADNVSNGNTPADVSEPNSEVQATGAQPKDVDTTLGIATETGEDQQPVADLPAVDAERTDENTGTEQLALDTEPMENTNSVDKGPEAAEEALKAEPVTEYPAGEVGALGPDANAVDVDVVQQEASAELTPADNDGDHPHPQENDDFPVEQPAVEEQQPENVITGNDMNTQEDQSSNDPPVANSNVVTRLPSMGSEEYISQEPTPRVLQPEPECAQSDSCDVEGGQVALNMDEGDNTGDASLQLAPENEQFPATDGEVVQAEDGVNHTAVEGNEFEEVEGGNLEAGQVTALETDEAGNEHLNPAAQAEQLQSDVPDIKVTSRPVTPTQAPDVNASAAEKPPTPPAFPSAGLAIAAPPRSPLVASRIASATREVEPAPALQTYQATAPVVEKAPPAAALKGLPVRAYMDSTVVPVLREALRALNDARPEDPLMFVAQQLLAARAALQGNA